ncbi:hypothetical protein J4458_01620 [Candidatus Woesearchaeota archaeon]|nr:hypothetical protein [Candidatus Woesearchaeota archaeon]
MEEEYDWNIILRNSLPVSAVMAFVFFTNIGNNLKWISLILALAATCLMVYFQSRKKHNIFTAMAIVLLVSLIAHSLRKFGFF